jgi:TRAP-type C4-dicarboxylate transport system permease small subunit
MALVALICADVIGRTVLNAPLPGVVEGVRVVIVVMLWLQVAHTLRLGRHMRSGVILARLGPGGQRAVLVLNAIAGATLFAIIGWSAGTNSRSPGRPASSRAATCASRSGRPGWPWRWGRA